MVKVLLVDDEPNIREVVGLYLRREGYTAIEAADGEEAVEMYRRHRPDLVILDLRLPKLDGLEVCRRIQSERSVPLIMLTAKGEEEDRVLGLNAGADDYVVKPFRPRELMARVAALLRRADEARAVPVNGRLLTFDGVRIDPGTREVVVWDTPVTLTAREFDLLYYLVSHPGETFTRDQLIEAVWDHEFAVDSSTVTVHMRHLREKLEDDIRQPRYLQTVWGVGYRFGGGE
jgi:DNA-binding response OmpR family regulator